MWKFIGIVVLMTLHAAVAPPVDGKKESETKEAGELDDFGLEYGRYLQQVVQALEEDKEFAKKLENVSAEQIRSGFIAKELEFVKHNVRSKLDELKRIEVDRLRKLIQEQMERTELGLYRDEDGRLLNSPDGRRWRTVPKSPKGLDRKGSVKIPKHLDIENPHSFEIDDLKKLIQTATNDLEAIERQRREEFKKYELEKEAAYRESLKNMTEEDKKKAEEHHEELIKKHKDHPKVHHPGSKPQLEQVWEEQDQMPREEFNPRTFFAMHDVNGDGHLDVQEVEAILIPEVKKLYNPNNEEDDPVEMEEEFHRMREHIFNETDKNKDALISLEEFLQMTEQQNFQQDEGWKGLDEQQIYSERELEEYMRQRQMYPQGHGDPRMYYDVGQGPGQGLPPHISYPQQPGYPQAPYPQGHQQGYPQQQFQQGHPQQQFQQGHPQQQFQQGHPQQQFQQGHPQQQFQQGQPQQFQQGHPPQFQQGHPPQFQQTQQQFQQGHPPQFQQGHPPQFQQGQQQFQQGHAPQFQQVPPQQFQQAQPQQYQQGQPQSGQPQQFQQGQPQLQQGQAPAHQVVSDNKPPNPQVAVASKENAGSAANLGAESVPNKANPSQDSSSVAPSNRHS